MEFGLAYKEILILDNGQQTNLKVMELEFGKQKINMRDNGKMD